MCILSQNGLVHLACDECETLTEHRGVACPDSWVHCYNSTGVGGCRKMLAFRRPSDEYLREFLKEQRDQAFSYSEVGASYGKTKENCADLKAAGYDVDHHHIRLGVGQRCFDAAVQAVREWKMHRFGSWVEIVFPGIQTYV